MPKISIFSRLWICCGKFVHPKIIQRRKDLACVYVCSFFSLSSLFCVEVCTNSRDHRYKRIHNERRNRDCYAKNWFVGQHFLFFFFSYSLSVSDRRTHWHRIMHVRLCYNLYVFLSHSLSLFLSSQLRFVRSLSD